LLLYPVFFAGVLISLPWIMAYGLKYRTWKCNWKQCIDNLRLNLLNIINI